MATEIFVEPELEELNEIENSTEWQLICEELHLNGQLSYTVKSETKQAPPYMFIDPKTERIIRTLCPCKVEAENYNASTIPLDILREIHKCKEHGWYKQIYIYYDNKTPDPFVIGFVSDEWNSHKHLIGRWGAELMPFEELEIKAIQRLKDAALQALFTTKAAIDFAYNNAEAFCKGMLSGQQAPKVDFDVPDLRQWNNSSLPF